MLTSADEHAQTSGPEHGDRHSPRPAESSDSAEATRRGARVGRAAIRSQHPSSRGRRTEGLCPVQVRRAHIRTPTRHRAPNQEPGRILVPGDGAAGDQGAQNRPACAAIAATRRLRPVPSQRFLALWSQAHTPSCSRQVTSTSIRMARPGPASAPRGHAPLRTDTLSLARTISDRRIFARCDVWDSGAAQSADPHVTVCAVRLVSWGGYARINAHRTSRTW